MRILLVEDDPQLGDGLTVGLRQSGFAVRLLEAQMSGLRDSGVKTLYLEVDESNIAALRLYARLGFQQVGQRPAYYKQGLAKPANALIMSAHL